MKQLKISWLCQAGFIFEADGKRVAVDPYMSNRLYEFTRKDKTMDRMMPVPVSFEELKPDLVAFTHDHADHYDEDSVRPIVGVYPDCKFLGPTSTFNHFVKDGFNRSNFNILDVGGKYNAEGVQITATVAHHSDPLAIGMIIRMGGKTVYLSGDTLFAPDLAAQVKAAAGGKIDIVIICINGKLGNMSWEDAVKVVAEIRPDIAIPMHYGLFARNTEDPQPFIAAVRKLGIESEEPTVKGRVF